MALDPVGCHDVRVMLMCAYEGDDRSLTIGAEPDDPGDMALPVPHDYVDEGGWRCFRDHEGNVISMRYDLARPEIDCSLVGERMGPSAMGLARRVLDESRGEPSAYVSHSHKL